MSELLHELIIKQSRINPDADAISHKGRSLTYGQLADSVVACGAGLVAMGLSRNERVAIYLPKQPETVMALFGTSWAGGVFVPINPLLKPEQVGHILRDCNARILITATERARLLNETLSECHDLNTVVLVDGEGKTLPDLARQQILQWQDLLRATHKTRKPGIDMDMAAILYTSGSTGRPKGVVLSHRNMVTGAKSVAQYLENTASDRLLAVLPLSFDYGFSQLSTAFSCGACTVLMDYLLPNDIVKTVAKETITGLAAVPPLWNQVANLEWPESARQSLRYITNSGGAMPGATLNRLRQALPNSKVFLMYGLTEAFRSTYLPPDELDRRPGSMGKAIPNVEVMVVRENGTACAPGEPGELVHRGSLVGMGYWNDRERTAERYRPAPGQEHGLPMPEMAVWSGDTVKMDEDGFLYFIGRKDDMIKTSGYRVSPTEVEEVIYATGMIGEVAALGIPHPIFGQAIIAVVTPKSTMHEINLDALQQECARRLPNFMLPTHILVRETLARNPNGKIDRKSLAGEMQNMFQDKAP